MQTTRRHFVASIAGMLVAAPQFERGRKNSPLNFEGPDVSPPDTKPVLHVASNQYPWFTFYQREGRSWTQDLDASLAEFRKSGVPGYEPIINSEQDIAALLPLLRKHGLSMHSAYVNSVLHDEQMATANIEQIVGYGKRLVAQGTRILVTNPSPIRWGGQEDKTDAQLITQARNLNELGKKLRESGITLAYHNHDTEMRQSAREFHHMMMGTDGDNVKLCLDAHWVFRGSGGSQVALFDIVSLYVRRVAEVHLRQSLDGIWTEAFGEGDIDYDRLAGEFKKYDVKPHLVLEQAVEKGTPQTMDAVGAHAKGHAFVQKVFSRII